MDFEHSIIKQSFLDRYTPKIEDNKLDSNINADGFGIGWYNEIDKKFYSFKNITPIWNDYNLDTISSNINSKIIFGHIRANLLGICAPVSIFNTHPFIIENKIWMHNGCIYNFKDNKYLFIDAIEKNIINKINGSTDSEYCFALYLTFYKKYKDPFYSMNKLINFIQNNKLKALCNFVVCSNDFIIATRFVINNNNNALSLYYNNLLKIISSEPLEYNNKKNWIIVPENSIIYLNKKTNNFQIY